MSTKQRPKKRWLPDGRTLALPDVTDFAELFPQVRDYEFNSSEKTPLLAEFDSWEKGSWSDPLGRKPGCQLRGFMSMSPRRRNDYRAWYVDKVSDGVLKAIGNMLHGSADTITFEIVDRGNNEALVIARYSQIIGSSWLAIIRTDTIPKEETDG